MTDTAQTTDQADQELACWHRGSQRSCCAGYHICRLHKPADCMISLSQFLGVRDQVPPEHRAGWDERIRCCETCEDRTLTDPDARPETPDSVSVATGNQPISFVWPYIHAQDDALRYSIRSVRKHFQGRALITIVGQKPDWYRGHVIRMPRTPAQPNRRWVEAAEKICEIARTSQLTETCVVMADDVYLMRPTDLADLAIPRAKQWQPSEDAQLTKWQREIARTIDACQQRGLPTWDYGTHAPRVVQRARLREVLTAFDMPASQLQWPLLYSNYWHRDAEPADPWPWIRRLLDRCSAECIRDVGSKCTVLNNAAAAWSADLQQYLSEQFPEASDVE